MPAAVVDVDVVLVAGVLVLVADIEVLDADDVVPPEVVVVLVEVARVVEVPLTVLVVGVVVVVYVVVGDVRKQSPTRSLTLHAPRDCESGKSNPTTLSVHVHLHDAK